MASKKSGGAAATNGTTTKRARKAPAPRKPPVFVVENEQDGSTVYVKAKNARAAKAYVVPKVKVRKATADDMYELGRNDGEVVDSTANEPGAQAELASDAASSASASA